MTDIRPGLAADAHTLTKIAYAAKQYWGYPQSWMKLWQEDLTVTPQYVEENPVYCAEIDNRIVGFVGLEINQREAEIHHLWVLPEHMGLGIGRLLVDSALRHCEMNGVERLRVVSDPNAIEFYRKLGAVHQGQVESNPAPRKLPVLQFDINQNAG